MKSVFIKINKEIPSLAVLAITILLMASCAPANHPPIITDLRAERDIVPSSGSCQVECIASDPDGDELSYEWLASGGNISGTGSTITWTAPDAVGTYSITVRVTDEQGGEATTNLTIEVAVNHAPIITSLTADKERVIPSGSCQVECIASDPDGDELSYEWSASGGNVSGTGSTITWTAPEAVGTYTITVKVIDDMGGENTSALNINVASNNPPVIENLIVTAEHRYLKEIPGAYQILQGKSCDIKCVALDPDKDELLYEWTCNGGNVCGEDPVVTWTAPLREGEVTVAVTVSDSSGGVATKSIVFQVETCAPCAFG